MLSIVTWLEEGTWSFYMVSRNDIYSRLLQIHEHNNQVDPPAQPSSIKEAYFLRVTWLGEGT
jgi:hypothetical protein